MDRLVSTRLSPIEKFGYAMGDFSTGLFNRFITFYLLYYLVELKGVGAGAAGTMLLVTRIFDAVTDPAMGMVADRTRSRWGRYRPYLLYGAIPFGVVSFFVFAMPDMGGLATLVWIYVFYSLAMLLYTVTNVPYCALLGVISPHSSERESAASWRFALLSLADVVIALGVTTIIRVVGGDNEAHGIIIAWSMIVVMMSLSLLLCFATTRERIAPPQHKSAIRQELRTLLRERSWWIAIGAAICVIATIVMMASSAVFYFRYLAVDDGQAVFLFVDRLGLFFLVGVSSVFGSLLAPKLFRQMDKGRLVAATFLVMAGLRLLYLLVPPDNYLFILLLNFLFNFTFGVTIVAIFAIFPDIARFIHWRSGIQMTGLVISASLFALKAGAALGGAVPAFILGASGFVAGAEQTEEGLWGIMLAFSVVPGCVALLGACFGGLYRISRRDLAEVEIGLTESSAQPV